MEKQTELQKKAEAIKRFAEILDEHTSDTEDVKYVIWAMAEMREHTQVLTMHGYSELGFHIRHIREQITKGINKGVFYDGDQRTFDDMSDSVLHGILMIAQYAKGFEIIQSCEKELAEIE